MQYGARGVLTNGSIYMNVTIHRDGWRSEVSFSTLGASRNSQCTESHTHFVVVSIYEALYSYFITVSNNCFIEHISDKNILFPLISINFLKFEILV